MKTLPHYRALVPMVLLLATAPLQSAEYFIARNGDDSKTGLSKKEAFGTLQKGIDALQAGDTLTIAPGEYFGSAQRTDLGSPQKETLIRAEIPGTVLLRGDVKSPVFNKLAGAQFVYVADFAGDVQAVNEVDSLNRFNPPVPSAQDLEFLPGGFFHDQMGKKLYISTTDLQSADRHTYTIAVTPKSGLTLLQPTRVTIEGLAATGYNTQSTRPLKAEDQMGTTWGFWMHNPKDCIIRDCVVFLNSGGIGVCNDRKGEGRGNTLIERCVVYGNDSPFVSSGGVVVYFPNNDVIRDCLAYRTDKYAFRFYQRGNGTALMEGNIATSGEMAIKGNALPEMSQVNNCIGLENMDSPTLKNSILGAENRRAATTKDPHTIFLGEEKGLDWNLEFADPLNADFRLQSSSRFRAQGKAPGRGPHPFTESVYYLSPSGDDQADGQSVKTAWKSLPRAINALKSGDTLYLGEGVYQGDVVMALKGADQKPIRLRGRGKDRALIDGRITIQGSSYLDFERLQFSKAIVAKESRDLSFANCTFSGAQTNLTAVGIENLRITHSIFTGFQESGLSLKDCAAVFLQGNIYDNRLGPAVTTQNASQIRYSDYNAYAAAGRAWSVEGKALGLPEWQAQHDTFSQVLRPEFSTANGSPYLANLQDFGGKGPLGTDLGGSRRERTKELRMAGPTVHSVSKTTANIEWQTTGAASCEIAWGPSADCQNKETVNTNYFGSWSLTGLKPETTYYFQIRSIQSQDETAETKKQIPTHINTQTISFTTAKEDRPPQKYYVSPSGNDKNSGLSQEQPWKTLSQAANRVNVGDTVLAAPGEYAEIIRLRATGTAEAPIRFEGLVGGEKVMVTGADKKLKNLFVIHGKNDIQIDRFYFKDVNPLGGSQRQPVCMAAVFSIAYAQDITITRSFYEGRGEGYSPAFLAAFMTENLLVKNCAVIAPMHGMYVMESKGFKLENNVFIRCQIGALHASDGRNKQMRISGNVFTDSLAYKPNGTVMEVPLGEVLEENNCYFLRTGTARKAIRIARAEKTDEDGPLFTYAEASKIFNSPSPSLVKNPRFRAFEKLTEKDISSLAEKNARPENQAKGRIYYPVDLLIDGEGVALDFSDLFVADEEAIKAGVGLMPAAFSEQTK